MSDFVNAADLITKKPKAKKDEPEPVRLQDDPDGRSYLEVLCDQAKAAVLTAKDETWEEDKKAIIQAVDFLANVARLSERPRAKAQAEEVLITVGICQSTEDLTTANIIPELDRIRRLVGLPNPATKGAVY